MDDRVAAQPVETPPVPRTAPALRTRRAPEEARSTWRGWRLLPAQHRLYPWIALLAGIVMIGRVASTIGHFSHTVDEPAHLSAGVAAFEARKHVYDVTHPPLPRMWAALPLVLAGAELPEARDVTVRKNDLAFDAGPKLLLDGPLSYRAALAAARAMMLAFLALALLYVYLLGRWLIDQRAAMLSVAFVSFDPNMMAHGALVTTDMPAVAGYLMAAYHGLRWIVLRTAAASVWAGLAFAAAASFKFSCLFVVPALMLFAAVRPLPALFAPLAAGRWRRYVRRWPPLRQVGVVIVVACVALWAVYLFNVDPLSSQSLMARNPLWLRLPESVKTLPMPMPSLVLGLWQLFAKSGQPVPSYLLGELSADGWWYYFPMTVLLKSPLGFVAALAASALAFAAGPRRRPWRTLAILAPPSVYAALSLASDMNFGLRHILPLIPFLYLFVCLQLARGWRLAVLLPLMALALIETAAVHPHYLAFFNAAAGGPAHGSRHLLDCNIDWGQDVGPMARWLRTHAADRGRPYSVRAFGATPPYLEGFGLDPSAAGPRARGLFAISKNVSLGLDEYQIRRGGPDVPAPDYRWLSRYPIVHRIGYSIDVYDLGNDVWELGGDNAWVRVQTGAPPVP